MKTYHADAFTILPTLEKESFDTVITDPALLLRRTRQTNETSAKTKTANTSQTTQNSPKWKTATAIA